MNYYNKIKKILEQKKGIKVSKKNNKIIITKNNKELTNYDLKFIEFSKNNLNAFLEYWKYKLNIK